MTRILLAEDEACVRTLLSETLARQGYDVVAVSTGEEALALSHDSVEPVRLLVTDLVLPGQNGTDLAAHLRERKPDLRVVFMSGYMDHPLLDEALDSSDSFISKPFSMSSFKEVVREALEPASQVSGEDHVSCS
jgi:two-component system, cell cycle sensor histidine kinase and response regulator CckA